MLTLKEIIFEDLTKNDNLGKIMTKCEQNEEFRDICLDAPSDFWKKIIIKLMGNIIVLKRRDLKTNKEWYEFAKELNLEHTFEYGIVVDRENDVTITPNPVSFFSIVKPFANGLATERATIDGILPVKGSVGYLLSLDVTHGRLRNEFFIDSDLEELQITVKHFIAETFYNILKVSAIKCLTVI